MQFEELTKTKVVGSTFTTNAQETFPTLRSGDFLDLVWEPDNEADNNAVAVYAGNEHLGYIPKANRYIHNGEIYDNKEGQDLVRDLRLQKEKQDLPSQVDLNKIVFGMLASGKDVRAQVLQITGGKKDEKYGCNIRLVKSKN